jgi:superfamily II DNA or RNA helicase
MADFINDKKLVLAPSHYILEQQKSKASWASQSTVFMTYAGTVNLSDNQLKDLKAKLIVLDEFHRCGAEVWGQGVDKILKAHPDALVLGTSATPIRYLDNSRDMSYELFGGVIAENLPLPDAIAKRILPSPIYISALYTLDEEIAELIDTLEKSKKPEDEKAEIASKINQAKINWEKTSGIPAILEKHLPPSINKIIIFCKDQEHLDQMEVEVARWFQKAQIRVMIESCV